MIRKGRLEEREAVNYFRQIIYGVDYCHKFNICHRDLKPENLLLDKNRNIKIADFGMAALETNDHMLETSCGSPHYASPEIVAGKNYHGAPSDIWSCGIILFALLTGHLPFDDDNIRRLLMKVQSGKYKMPEDLSREAKDLIQRMLQIDPENRIKMAEILHHPLLRKYPAKRAAQQRRIANSGTQDVSAPIKRVEDIDMEILKNLQILWHGEDQEKIVERLMSPELNTEKTFYCLLVKYRHDHRHDSKYNDGINTNHRQRSSNSIALNHSHRQRSNRSLSAAHRNRSNQSLNAASHRKRSSQSITRHAKGHSRSGSRTSVITASSSHRHNVSFAAVKRATQHSHRNDDFTFMQQQPVTQTAHQPQQPVMSTPVTRDPRVSVELPHETRTPVDTRTIGTSTEYTEPEPNRISSNRSSAYRESYLESVVSAYRDDNRLSYQESILSRRDSRASTYSNNNRDSMINRDPMDAYFNQQHQQSSGSTPASGTRVTSDPTPPRPIDSSRVERRAVSLGSERRASLLDPGRPQSFLSTHSTVSADSVATPNPMTPEIAAPMQMGGNNYQLPRIFEEDRFADAVEEEVNERMYSHTQTGRAVAQDFDLFNDKEDDLNFYKTLHLPDLPPLRQNPEKEPSRLQISGLIKTDSFKARTSMYDNPPPAMAVQQQPPPSQGRNNGTEQPRRTTTPPQAGVPKPLSVKRRPLATKDNNSANSGTKGDTMPKAVATNVTPQIKQEPRQESRQESRQREEQRRSSGDEKPSIFRRLTRRGPPSGNSNSSAASSDARTPRDPPPPVAVNSTEPKQNWFMKILSSNTGKVAQPSKTIYSTLPINRLRLAILDILHAWRKYGITNIVEDPHANTIHATISSRNVLKVRSSKFRVNIDTIRAVSAATFVKEKGSSASFQRFLGEIEAALNEFTESYNRRRQRASYRYEQKIRNV